MPGSPQPSPRWLRTYTYRILCVMKTEARIVRRIVVLRRIDAAVVDAKAHLRTQTIAIHSEGKLLLAFCTSY